jgi:hypothetical protein
MKWVEVCAVRYRLIVVKLGEKEDCVNVNWIDGAQDDVH